MNRRQTELAVGKNRHLFVALCFYAQTDAVKAAKTTADGIEVRLKTPKLKIENQKSKK